MSPAPTIVLNKLMKDDLAEAPVVNSGIVGGIKAGWDSPDSSNGVGGFK